jgi:hypothetical protein
MDTQGAYVFDSQGNQRVKPQLGPEHMKSYQIAAPVSTHWRLASCEEVGCEKFIKGHALVIDESSPLGQFQASYVRGDRSRGCTESRDEMGMTVFTYPPGNRCFEEHRVRLEREENFLITGGDWRGNPRQIPARMLRAEDWVDDFANHQDRIKTAHDRG